MMRDIRFVGLCRKLDLFDYWLKTNRRPDNDKVLRGYDALVMIF